MSRAICTTCSVVRKRLSEIRMGEHERREAMQAMRDADALADAVIWVKDRFAALGTVLPRLGFKH